MKVICEEVFFVYTNSRLGKDQYLRIRIIHASTRPKRFNARRTVHHAHIYTTNESSITAQKRMCFYYSYLLGNRMRQRIESTAATETRCSMLGGRHIIRIHMIHSITASHHQTWTNACVLTESQQETTTRENLDFKYLIHWMRIHKHRFVFGLEIFRSCFWKTIIAWNSDKLEFERQQNERYWWRWTNLCFFFVNNWGKVRKHMKHMTSYRWNLMIA